MSTLASDVADGGSGGTNGGDGDDTGGGDGGGGGDTGGGGGDDTGGGGDDGGGDDTGGGGDDGGDDDTGGGGDDGGDGGSDPPVAMPFRWDVSLASSHQPACFRPGSELPLIVAVYDRNDAPIPDPQYEVASDVTGAVESDGFESWIVRGEGDTRITVTYAGATAPDATIAPVVLDVLRDGTPPQIAVHQPARGAMLTAGGDVRVQGLVTDATSPLESVSVNGLEQPTAGASEAAIDVTPPGRWGLNVIDVVASDRCGNRSTYSQSYLRSPEYRPAATAASAAARVARGQTLRLTQPIVDDLDRSDIDDFATLAERYLERHLSDVLSDQTSGEVLASDSAACPGVGYTLSVGAAGLTLLGPRVREVELQQGQIRQDLSAERVNLPLRFVQVTRVGIPLTGCLANSTSFNASLSAHVTSDSTSVATVAGNGQIDVTLPTVAVELSDVQLVLTGNAFVDGVLSSLLGLMTNFAEDAIEGAITSELPPLLEDFLNTPLTAGTTIAGGPFDMTLNIVAGIDGIEVVPIATTETAYTQVYPGGTGTPYPALGAITRPTDPADLTSTPGPVTYAIDDNLTNQGLWALWHAGALEVPDVIGFAGTELQISGLLPPVLMPGAQPDGATFGIGDVAMTLRLDSGPETLPQSGPFEVAAFVSLLVEGGVEFDFTTQQMRISSAPENRNVYVHIERVTDGTGEVTDPAARALIESYAARLMARSIEQFADETLVSVVLPQARFQLEEPALGGTVDGFELDITGLTRAADHLVIDMDARADGPPGFVPDGYLTLNEAWDQDDLKDLNIPDDYLKSTPHTEDPVESAISSRSITIADYRHLTRPQCESEGNSPQGDPICLPQWKFPLNYGYYCGGSRPVIGFAENPRLDPVDYCCRLHDRNLFDPEGGAKSPHNACGFAMCVSQAIGYPADITRLLPDVERARRQMYNKAAMLCGPAVQPELPAPEIVAP